MAAPQQQIEGDLKTAMKARDSIKVATLRMLLADIKNEKIRAGEPVDDAGFTRLVRKAIKQRKEASSQYRDGGRPELADKEEAEAALLADYLPPEISEDTIRAAILEVIAAENLTAPAGMGVVMKTVMGRFAGQLDGSVVQKLARELLPSS